MTKLDLWKGYWQVPLTPRASQLSAFVTPEAFLQYRVMAFELLNVAGTFLRLVNTLFADVSNCTAYLDGVVIYSTDWDSHLATLRTVFNCFAEANLTLNLGKCEFAQATVTYLGKQVGQGQVRPLEDPCCCALPNT